MVEKGDDPQLSYTAGKTKFSCSALSDAPLARMLASITAMEEDKVLD